MFVLFSSSFMFTLSFICGIFPLPLSLFIPEKSDFADIYI